MTSAPVLAEEMLSMHVPAYTCGLGRVRKREVLPDNSDVWQAERTQCSGQPLWLGRPPGSCLPPSTQGWGTAHAVEVPSPHPHAEVFQEWKS